jgi:CIC family chloride channel protein
MGPGVTAGDHAAEPDLSVSARGGPLRLPREPGIRLLDWLRGSAAGLMVLAVVTGAGAGGGAVGFRYLIVGFTKLFTGRSDYSDA